MTFSIRHDFKQWQTFQHKVQEGGNRWPDISQRVYVDVGRIIHDQVWKAYTTERGPGHGMPAIASGAYGGELLVTPTSTGVIVSANARHAGYLELGTGPHFPPRGVIRAWMEVKGLDADDDLVNAIVTNIGRRGTPPRFFLRDVFRKPGTITQVNQRINKAISELAEAMGFVGGGNAGSSGRR